MDEFGVDLPLIGNYLAHSWVDNTLAAKKAGKLDDAGIPTHIWDQPIVQVLDLSILVINTMWKRLFKCYYYHGLMLS